MDPETTAVPCPLGRDPLDESQRIVADLEAALAAPASDPVTA